jgi:hypothetical protein
MKYITILTLFLLAQVELLAKQNKKMYHSRMPNFE